MGRYFNTEGLCNPDIHYMVKLDDRLAQIRQLFVDRGKYFVINRGRQYGKTTTLRALAEYLKDDYMVISMDFQLISTANFIEESRFVIAFIECLKDVLSEKEDLEESLDLETLQNMFSLKDDDRISMDSLFRELSKVCKSAKKPVVLMIDEVDSASNHQVFLDFLALLRGYYLNREYKATFYSVVLAGVYDIKNLKLKIRPEEEHKYNSPWNIAAKFNLAMSFSAEQIMAMLQEYEEDHHTGMDVRAVGNCIYEYTSGYPYLVSAICKSLDEEIYGSSGFENIQDIWTERGIREAVKILLSENIPLFGSMVKQLDIYKDLRKMIEEILYQGKEIFYSPDVDSINIGLMFGLLKREDTHVAVSNRIFEMRLLNMFIAEESAGSEAFRYGHS